MALFFWTVARLMFCSLLTITTALPAVSSLPILHSPQVIICLFPPFTLGTTFLYWSLICCCLFFLPPPGPDSESCPATVHPRPKGPDTAVCLSEWPNGLYPSIIMQWLFWVFFKIMGMCIFTISAVIMKREGGYFLLLHRVENSIVFITVVDRIIKQYFC